MRATVAYHQLFPKKMGDSIPVGRDDLADLGIAREDVFFRHKRSDFAAGMVRKTLRVDFKGIFRGISYTLGKKSRNTMGHAIGILVLYSVKGHENTLATKTKSR